MKYLCLIRDEEAKLAAMPTAESDAFMERYFEFTQSVMASGQYVAGEALQPAQTAMTVRIRDGKLITTDGPFAETHEQVGGFYLIEARDLTEAVRIAARIPSAHTGSIEVRPVVDFSQPGANAEAMKQSAEAHR